MSRGPGRKQRLILKSLERARSFFLVSLLPKRFTPAAYASLLRAARRLYENDRIDAVKWDTRHPEHGGLLVIYRPGDPEPAQD
jgi:hypothetical protein